MFACPQKPTHTPTHTCKHFHACHDWLSVQGEILSCLYVFRVSILYNCSSFIKGPIFLTIWSLKMVNTEYGKQVSFPFLILTHTSGLTH